MKKGICCAGNMIVDITYPIETWPKQNELTHITEGNKQSTGGSVCNTISDLARLDPQLPLVASGFAGHDAEGDFVLQEMGKYKNIDLSMVKRNGRTSFTAVMSNNQTKERTFFQHAGANAYYGEDDIDWDKLDVDIFHIGYILLLPHLDEPDAEYGTKMARLLHRAQKAGMKTSIAETDMPLPEALKLGACSAAASLSEVSASDGVKTKDEVLKLYELYGMNEKKTDRITNKQAVMYGGGNIGRGFIGATLSQSGYEVTFIDVAEPVVKALQEKKQYPVRYVSSEGHEDVTIEHVTAVNGNDQEAASEAIANCDIMATAVGARILKFIVGNIVAGLRKRWARDDRPLNIIICENLMDANKVMEGMLKDLLTDEEKKHFDEKVGLVEASIGRMVPVQTEEMKDGDPMRVCVERYGVLPVDKAAFKGEIPEITNMVPFEPFDFYIKRKLYVHNMGHATCAYLGGYEGRKYIYQSIDDPEVLTIVQNAMLESALALSKKYGVELDGLMLHITDLLGRFRNAALKDTCKRVGGDPTRKLGAADRLIGSSLLCLEQGVKPAYIAVGAAGAVYRYLNEAGVEQSKEEAAKVLKEVSGLEADSELAGMILDMYAYFLEGEPVSALRRAAQAAKTAGLGRII